jgi:hypothetical protein
MKKWIYFQEVKQQFYLAEGERGPICRTKQKDHIENIMKMETRQYTYNMTMQQALISEVTMFLFRCR